MFTFRLCAFRSASKTLGSDRLNILMRRDCLALPIASSSGPMVSSGMTMSFRIIILSNRLHTLVGLTSMQSRIEAAKRQEAFVVAFLGDSPVLKNDNVVRALEG